MLRVAAMAAAPAGGAIVSAMSVVLTRGTLAKPVVCAACDPSALLREWFGDVLQVHAGADRS